MHEAIALGNHIANYTSLQRTGILARLHRSCFANLRS